MNCRPVPFQVGALIAYREAGRARDGHRLLECRCECGRVLHRRSNNLLRAKSRCICKTNSKGVSNA